MYNGVFVHEDVLRDCKGRKRSKEVFREESDYDAVDEEKTGFLTKLHLISVRKGVVYIFHKLPVVRKSNIFTGVIEAVTTVGVTRENPLLL